MAQRTPRAELTQLAIEYVTTTQLKPNPDNARRHPGKQIAKLCRAIRKFGLTNPIVIDEAEMILCGHARFAAARQLELVSVPCLRLTHLSPAEKTAFALADNRLGDESEFDPEALQRLLRGLADVEFDLELTCFDTAETDFHLEGAGGKGVADPADRDAEPDPERPPVSRSGDLWLLGPHRLTCASALEAEPYERLLRGQRAAMVFSDSPYNVPVAGHVSGSGRHREFAMASGEMSTDQFRAFLATSMGLLVRFTTDGSIHFLCMDWRGLRTLLEAADGVYTELKNLCVWDKGLGGMGSLYRSQHELVAVFKNGTASHQNNVELGRHGRYRTNLWAYPGANSFGPTRASDLAAHPTCKPVALVADAIRDCSKRGATILDPFMGSGTTILAAERTGRKAAGIEIDPIYVDTAIRRWQRLTGKAAVLEGDSRTFEEVEAERLAAADNAETPALPEEVR